MTRKTEAVSGVKGRESLHALCFIVGASMCLAQRAYAAPVAEQIDSGRTCGLLRPSGSRLESRRRGDMVEFSEQFFASHSYGQISFSRVDVTPLLRLSGNRFLLRRWLVPFEARFTR